MGAAESAAAIGRRGRALEMSVAERPALRNSILEIALAAFVLITVAAHASGQTPPPTAPPLSHLKKLSLDELQTIEVTSVSKRPEELSRAPSAIQVITGDDIRRAGATSLPEALRLASNLHVAQIDSHDWAISPRRLCPSHSRTAKLGSPAERS